MPHVLIIDDDDLMCDMLSDMVESMGYHASCATTLREGLAMISSGPVDVVFLDIRMPDGSGLDTLPRIKALPSSPEVIIITGMGDPDGAEIAIKNGAWDYIQKSSSIKEMTLPFMRALQYREEKRTRRPLAAFKAEGMVGNCAAIRRCLDVMAEAAQSDASVLVVGETGTGKELCARAIHDNGPRATRNFVVVDCAALPATLVESVLFGHEKGAFTGAEKSQEGLIRQAHGGTLFLDEIGELSLDLQVKLLRVLEEGRFERLGSTKSLQINVRIIAATNRDLAQEVVAKRFRSDLYYRLNVFPILVPPLRERLEDIPSLVWTFVKQYEKKMDKRIDRIPRKSMDALQRYAWPGNVRELKNIVEHAIITSRDESLRLRLPHLPSDEISTKGNLEDVERRHILEVLKQTEWRIAGKGGAAEILGMKRTTLLSKMKKLGIRRPGS